jgi:hypothetical protein
MQNAAPILIFTADPLILGAEPGIWRRIQLRFDVFGAETDAGVVEERDVVAAHRRLRL